jgi:hypothetical protein
MGLDGLTTALSPGHLLMGQCWLFIRRLSHNTHPHLPHRMPLRWGHRSQMRRRLSIWRGVIQW